MTGETIDRLRNYFVTRSDVAFALLFGSAAKGRETIESDVDVAVYVRTKDERALDVEAPRSFPQEDEIWSAVERIVDREVDLLVLNRAPATVAAAALYDGCELSVKDRGLYTRFFLATTLVAEDFRRFIDEFVTVRKRSQSLSATDRLRLVRITQYIRQELADAHMYRDVDRPKYLGDAHLRRGMERWVENLVNASIDTAKIIVASERLPMPHTYRGTMETLGALPPFAQLADRLAANTTARNALAHEYLDIRYPEVRRVADEAEELYGALADATERWIDAQALRS
jgi:uncharacterized protein